MLCFRTPARRYEFFLVMFFATDEINGNPYLLPNMTLIFSVIDGLCGDTLLLLDIIYSKQKNRVPVINYVCGNVHICKVDLTGPSWKASLKAATHSRTPQVRMGETEDSTIYI